MRLTDHVVGEGTDGTGGTGKRAGRLGDVFDSHRGAVRAQVAPGGQVALDRAVAAPRHVQSIWAATQPQRPRPTVTSRQNWIAR